MQPLYLYPLTLLIATLSTHPSTTPSTTTIITTPVSTHTTPQHPSGQILRTHRIPLLNKQAAVIRSADIPQENWHAGHRGVDLEASPGDTVVASRGGVVAFAGVVAGTPVVSVEHSDGVRTTYEPVLAQVKKGQSVTRGQTIGLLADKATLPETARTSPGLSWGARLSPRHYIDPLSLLGDVRVRLVE